MKQLKTFPAPFTKGLNLSRWLEKPTLDMVIADEFTRQDFANIKSLGCEAIRLPIHFERYCDASRGWAVPDRLWSILDSTLSWAEELGLYLIFDFHNATQVDTVTAADVESVLSPIWAQVAGRYRGASDLLIYEIMNEPHGIPIADWNRIAENIYRQIRAVDARRWLIVGGADWNSTAAMKTLPDFGDGRVMYTFHFYEPMAFTHQGAPWAHMERVRDIPFPYDPAKMPPMPENPTEREKMFWTEYPEKGTLEAVERFFDEYVAFSQSRHAPVFCGEFGTSAICAPQGERVKWYRLVSGLLEERGIARCSWDYYGSFGVFCNTYPECGVTVKPTFPEGLNVPLLEAMGLHAPEEVQ